MAPYNNAPEAGTRNGRSADRGAGAGALVGGALFVSVIALCALFIAYEGIYRLAAIVHAESTLPLAHVFPVTFTLLVLMAFWVSYILRTAPPRERLWIDIGLIPLLILSAAVPMALTRTTWFGEIGDTLPRGLTVVVAVAPLAALLVAFLLWIAVRAHVRRRGTMIRPRPKPSDDRTTVLRGTPKPRSRTQEEGLEAPEALRTRLLRLGGDPEATETPETTEVPMPSEEVSESEESVWARRIESDESYEGSERTDAPDEDTLHEHLSAVQDVPEAPAEPLPNPWDRAEGETSMAAAEAEPSAPTIPLPRRARTGDNPIKRAAAEPPVVPGAATPEPAEGTSSHAYASNIPEDPENTEEHFVDEGFVHTPEVGDPSSDEAEAPIPIPPIVEPAANVEPEPAAPDTDIMGMGVEEDAYASQDTDPFVGFEETPKHPERSQPERLPGVRLFFPEHSPEPVDAAETGSEAFEPSETPAEPVTTNVSEPSAADEAADQEDEEDHTPLWEPPSDDHSTSALDEYVPPVWTPPEDDPSALDVPATPIHSLSTRTGSVPGPTLDHDTGPTVRAAFRLGSVPPGAAPPEPELPPKVEEERRERELPQPSPRRTGPLGKRPMVLKPPRPPMPDFASGPPSQRVRSEPLPPGDD